MVYTEKPNEFDPTLEVVGCFIEYKDTFLLLKRQQGKSEAGTYGLVGGKVDKTDASIELAMCREIYEETKIEVSVADVQFFKTVYVQNFDYQAIFHLFSVHCVDKPHVVLHASEHSEYTWTTFLEYKRLPLMIDVIPCIDLKYKNI